jgi:hypothetical protein
MENPMKYSYRVGLVVILTVSILVPLSAQRPGDPTVALIPSLKSADRSVICGTTILSGGAALDPTIGKRLPPGNFTMHVVRPKMCGDNSRASNAPRFPPAGTSDDIKNRLPMFFGPKR